MSDQVRNTTQLTSVAAAELPATVEDLIAQRRAGGAKTINDYVEELHLRLWPNPKYRALFAPLHVSEAITGAFVHDDGEKARMIIAYADEIGGYSMVASRKLAVIVKAVHVVENRYHIGRRERANMIGGVVPMETTDRSSYPQH